MFGVLADVLSRFVPEQRELLHLSFALADADRLERMFSTAGFSDVRVERLLRKGTIPSLDEYWAPIETGMGQQPQLYLALDETDRRTVRNADWRGEGMMTLTQIQPNTSPKQRERKTHAEGYVLR
jgi:hypothetical protein